MIINSVSYKVFDNFANKDVIIIFWIMNGESMAIKTVVKKSEIHGKGLFAASNIKANVLIGNIKGKSTDQDGPHVLWIEDDKGVAVEGKLKYINHSQNPNACYYNDLTVVALKDINSGEEITHDYGKDWHLS